MYATNMSFSLYIYTYLSIHAYKTILFEMDNVFPPDDL